MHGYASGPTAADTDVVGKRVGAAIVDSVIGFVLYFVLAGTILGGGLNSGNIVMAMFVLPFAVFVGYYIVFEGLWGGATPGKRLFGIEVVRESGAPIDVGDAVVRNVLRFVDGVCYYAVGFVLMATSDRKQRLGDRLASTVVVAADSTHGTGNPHSHHGRAHQGNAVGQQGGGRSRRRSGQTGHRNQANQHGQQARHRGQQTGYDQRSAYNQQTGEVPESRTQRTGAGGHDGQTNGRQGARMSSAQQQTATQRGASQQQGASQSRNTGNAVDGGVDYRPERNSGAP